MKIYEIGTGYTPIPAQMGAATEIVVEGLVKAYQDQGLPIKLIDIKAKDRVPNDMPIIEVPVPESMCGTDVKLGIMHKLKRVVYSVSLANTLCGILKKSKEEVLLHFHNQYNLFFFHKLVPKRLRNKACIVYTNHSYIWHDSWEKIEETIRKRYFQEVYSIEHADHVFVLNEQTRENLLNHLDVDSNRVHLIANGVNIDVYSPFDAEKKAQNRQAWNLEGKHVFIQVGSVCERKGQLDSLKLLTKMMRENPTFVFCYAGGIIDPQYYAEIEKYAVEHGIEKQVRYMGEIEPGERLNSFYNLAEAMVFPSKAEGFSLVIIEAMSAGIPVLINKKLRFELADKCCQYDNDEMFANLVRNDILDIENHARLSHNIRQMVVDAYSWEKISKDYLSFLE